MSSHSSLCFRTMSELEVSNRSFQAGTESVWQTPSHGGKLQGFGSLDKVEWRCPSAKPTEKQPSFHHFNISEAQINLTPSPDFLSSKDGFNDDLFCILLHQLLLATGWRSSRSIIDSKWFDKTRDSLSAEMPFIPQEIRSSTEDPPSTEHQGNVHYSYNQNTCRSLFAYCSAKSF